LVLHKSHLTLQSSMLAMVAVSLSWLGVKQRLYRKGRLLSRPFFVGVMLLANILKLISIACVSK